MPSLQSWRRLRKGRLSINGFHLRNWKLHYLVVFRRWSDAERVVCEVRKSLTGSVGSGMGSGERVQLDSWWECINWSSGWVWRASERLSDRRRLLVKYVVRRDTVDTVWLQIFRQGCSVGVCAFEGDELGP